MIEFERYDDIPKDFTGVCKILWDLSTRYFKNGLHHREDGPAVEFMSGTKYWYINGLYHREDGPAREFYNGNSKNWYYRGKCFGYNNAFTIETWKEKVKQLKREEELSIFI